MKKIKSYIYSLIILFSITPIGFCQLGWQNIYFPNNPPVAYHETKLFFFNVNTGIVGGYYYDNGTHISTLTILKTTNRGTNWTTTYSSTDKGNVFELQFINSTDGFFLSHNASTNRSYLFRTANSGDSWSQITGWVGLWLSGFFVDINTGFIINVNQSTAQYTLLKTLNGGSSFSTTSFGTNRLQDVFFINANTGFLLRDSILTGSSSQILKTTNGGGNWFTCYYSLGHVLNNICFLNDMTGYVGGGAEQGIYIGKNYVAKSTDGGYNWNFIQLDSGNGSAGGSIVKYMVFKDSTIGYLGAYATFQQHLYKTTNSGSNWNVIDAFSGNDACFISNDTGFVGTEGSLRVTFSGGMYFNQGPTLQLPTNNSQNIQPNTVLDWQDLINAVNYRVNISTDSLFQNIVYDSSDVTLSQLTIPNGRINYSTKYFWRVQGKKDPQLSPWSSIWNFTTILQTPTLISPTNGASSVTLTPLIDWSDVSGATSYNIQVANNSGFTSPIIDLSSLPSSQYQVPSGLLQANTLYYWRASASNSNGTSAWATAWNFTTIASPNTPNLISPTNGSNILTLTPTLDWSDVTGATSYAVQVATDTNFINLAVNQSGLTVSQYTVTSGVLTGNTTYYWRARAGNEAGPGPWSVRWYFRVVTIPPAPNLVSPPNNSTNQPPTVMLDWDSLASANTYRIQLATDSLFNSIVFDTSGVTRSYLQMRPGILLANVKYYWKVNATNLAGTGPWSVVWNFRVNPTGLYQYSSAIPKEFKLHNNYPNPFNPITKIRFDIPKNTYVKIRIFDLTGKEIMKLLNDYLSAGAYEILWNANNYSSGVYFYRIEAGSFVQIKKMVLIK